MNILVITQDSGLEIIRILWKSDHLVPLIDITMNYQPFADYRSNYQNLFTVALHKTN